MKRCTASTMLPQSILVRRNICCRNTRGAPAVSRLIRCANNARGPKKERERERERERQKEREELEAMKATRLSWTKRRFLLSSSCAAILPSLILLLRRKFAESIINRGITRGEIDSDDDFGIPDCSCDRFLQRAVFASRTNLRSNILYGNNICKGDAQEGARSVH